MRSDKVGIRMRNRRKGEKIDLSQTSQKASQVIKAALDSTKQSTNDSKATGSANNKQAEQGS